MNKLSLTKVTISGVEFYAYHGVKPEERTLGGKYEVDLDLYYDARIAILNDSVEFGLNYEEALYVISDVMGGEYMLIETIANEILNALMDKFPDLHKATIKIKKFNVPLRRVIGYVSAEQTIQRNVQSE